MLPNLIIPGSQKCGTSSIYRYLSEHPSCLMSEPKEPAFFSKAENLGHIDRYRALFAAGRRGEPSPKVIGEATTAYLPDAHVPQRIKQALGEVKLVFVLRNPVDRALSAYWHTCKRRDESRGLSDVFGQLSTDPDAAVEQEAEDVRAAARTGTIDVGRYSGRYDDALWPFRYVGNSRYSVALERFDRLFPARDMHILILEQFIRDPDGEFQRLAEFLKIDPDISHADLTKTHNRTVIPRSDAIGRTAWRLGNTRLGRSARRRCRFVDRAHQRLAVRTKPPAVPGIREQLAALFHSERQAISDRVGRDLQELGW